MSAAHPWLAFVGGGPALPHGLDADVAGWRRLLSAQHARWYDGAAPPAVAAVFVLQWLLQVPAHTAATAAGTGPWQVEGLAGLRFARGAGLTPELVRLERLGPDDRPLENRLATAEASYRQVAEPLAARYAAPVRIGPRTRAGLVDDMWAEARRVGLAAAGAPVGPPPPRASCCLIYALPGCHECAGCPRVPTQSG